MAERLIERRTITQGDTTHASEELRKPLALAVGAAIATSLAAVSVAQANPFSLTALSSAYMAADGEDARAKGTEGKCGEGKCGADKAKAEGKCGEGKCGAEKAKGEGKCGEGKCGADMKEGEKQGEKKPEQA